MRKSPREIALLRAGNRLVAHPSPREVRRLLRRELTFKTVRFLHGREAAEAVAAGYSPVEVVRHQMWVKDFRGRIGFLFGYYRRVLDTLAAAGYSAGIVDVKSHPDPTVFLPDFERPARFGLPEPRPDQWQCVLDILTHPCGRICCPTGWGKSFVIVLLAMLLPKARIDVIADSVPVLRDRLLPELRQYIPNVGMVGGGKREGHRRITLVSADSLHHRDGSADIVLIDEVHQAAADEISQKLVRYAYSRIFGFSATIDMRPDRKDFRTEGLCGPVIHRVSYQDAVTSGTVLPIECRWRPVPCTTNPVEGVVNRTRRLRYGIWRNRDRNQAIAETVRGHGDEQVLISCATLEHAVYLKHLLPEYALVYAKASMTAERRAEYLRLGLLDSSEPPMTPAREIWLAREFGSGRLRKAICTTVWNVGVDFPELGVLVRADGTTSPIACTQIPGRLSRRGGGEKSLGLLYDFTDRFDAGFARQASQRRSTYILHGWRQVGGDTTPTTGRRYHSRKETADEA